MARQGASSCSDKLSPREQLQRQRRLSAVVACGAVERVTGHCRHWAVVNGEISSVGMLLEAKAETLAINRNGVTPLHFAAEGSKKDHFKILKLLLQNLTDNHVCCRSRDARSVTVWQMVDQIDMKTKVTGAPVASLLADVTCPAGGGYAFALGVFEQTTSTRGLPPELSGQV
eukprot:764923-Hanusia_phi.AAC.14